MSSETTSLTNDLRLNADDSLVYPATSSDIKQPILGNFEDTIDDNKEPLLTQFTSSPIEFLKNKFKAGSIKGSIFTLITATIGTGILLIPNSIAASGIYWGMIQFIFCGWLGYYSLMLIVKCGEKTGLYSYQAIALKYYGKWYRNIVNVVFFFANWGTTIAYMVLTCQLLATVMKIFFTPSSLPGWLSWLTDKSSIYWFASLTTFLVVPLSLPKELKSLRYFCLLSFVFVIYLCLVVVTESFNYDPPFADNLSSAKLWIWGGASTTFPTGIFAYMSHPNVLDVFRELHNNTIRRMRKVILRTILLVFVTYTLVGGFGYIGFARHMSTLTDDADGVILVAYGYSPDGSSENNFSFAVILCILLISLSVVIAIPMNVKPTKDSLRDTIYPDAQTTPDQDPPSRHVPLVLCKTGNIFVNRIVTVFSAMFVGLYIPGMQQAINILGSSFFSMICFIFPTTFYLKITQGEPLWGDRLICYILLGTMSAFAVWGTIQNLS